MVFALLKQSFINQKRAMALMVVSVAMGTAVVASLLTLSLEIQGKVSQELRSFGANITIVPKVEGFADLAGQRRYLKQEDLIKAKTIFWRHNILGLVPFLEEPVRASIAGAPARELQAIGTWHKHSLPLPGEKTQFEVGVASVLPWWDMRLGAPGPGEVLVGERLMRELSIKDGDIIEIEGQAFKVRGAFISGGDEDGKLLFDLEALQNLKHLPGVVSRVQVSALTTPMDEFAYKDPASMSRAEYEKWYCTGYVTSIAKQLEEVFTGSQARPIWNVAQAEGKVLERMTVLIYLLTAASLLAGALGMSSTMAASLLKRMDEVGLMKSLGADSWGIIVIFMSEAAVIGIAGGLCGYLLSLVAVKYIGLKVFGAALASRKLLFPVALISAFVIAALGSMLPIRRALMVKPAIVLKEAH